MLRYGTADYAVFPNFLWEVSVGILSCISLKNLSGQRLVMPCQVPSVTVGPDQQENGFLVKARNEYLGGVNAAPGLQPSTQESALLSFPPSQYEACLLFRCYSYGRPKKPGMRCP